MPKIHPMGVRSLLATLSISIPLLAQPAQAAKPGNEIDLSACASLPAARSDQFHGYPLGNDLSLFMAGNQLGKTLAGGFEFAMHLSGRYPDWWAGRRFERPVRLWAASVTGESTRDNPQRILLGPPAIRRDWGTGTIPALIAP